jgi:hypothetical protein
MRFLYASLLLLSACNPDDVCSDRDEAACLDDPEDACLWEAGSGECLQLCRGGAGCPDDLTCNEQSSVDLCAPDADICAAIALVDDVCRPD